MEIWSSLEKMASVRNSESAVFRDRKERIPSDLPEESIRVGKVSRIPAPEGFLRGLHNFRANTPGFVKNVVHVFAAARVVCDRHAIESFSGRRHIRIFCQFFFRIQGERDSSRLKEDDAFRLRHRSAPSQLFIKFSAAGEIRYAKRNDAD